MKLDHFKEPKLFIAKAPELPLSGTALLELMQAVLAKSVPFRFRARGWSMTPFIRDGDIITITPIQDKRPVLGDIVAFIRPTENRLVVHRIVNLHGSDFMIQGDCAPDHPDGVIPAGNLLGKVARIERDGHRVWLGIGPEKTIIAWLSRNRILDPLRQKITLWLKPASFRRR